MVAWLCHRWLIRQEMAAQHRSCHSIGRPPPPHDVTHRAEGSLCARKALAEAGASGVPPCWSGSAIGGSSSAPESDRCLLERPPCCQCTASHLGERVRPIPASDFAHARLQRQREAERTHPNQRQAPGDHRHRGLARTPLDAPSRADDYSWRECRARTPRRPAARPTPFSHTVASVRETAAGANPAHPAGRLPHPNGLPCWLHVLLPAWAVLVGA